MLGWDPEAEERGEKGTIDLPEIRLASWRSELKIETHDMSTHKV